MIRYDTPRQAVMGVPDLAADEARTLAVRAAELTRQYLPRVTGASAASLFGIWGPEWFGVEWMHDSIWFQERGIRPFTMHSLAGKTIPMWVSDRDGSIRAKDPKAKTRVRADSGETEVLIFRRAANRGERRDVWRMEGGRMVRRNVPASYPGAPGRIAVNRSRGIMRAGDVDPNASNPGQIARGNVGVRWRHPGLRAGDSIMRGIHDAAQEAGFPVGEVRYLSAFTVANEQPYDIVTTRR